MVRHLRDAIWFVLPTAALLLGVVLALNWKTLTAERRPTLLADAQWDEPATARAFLARFPRGSNEGGLLQWLQSNHFIVDRRAGRATRLVHSVPCEEDVEIAWTRESANTIGSAEARVSDAGCLD